MRREMFGWAKLLGLIALSGLVLRLYGINFGLPGLYDPDELMFELGAIRMLSHATLNPGWFGHPATTTMYGLALCNIGVFGFGHLVGWFPTLKSFGEAVYTNPGWVVLPGRVLMALFGAGTIWQTGKLGEALFNRRAGLLAALLVALSPVAIAWAQVIRSDIMGTFFVLLSLRAMVKAIDSGRWQDDARAAIWLGVAIATKWPMGVPAVAMAAALGREVIVGRLHWGAAFRRLMVFGGTALLALVITSPYLIIAFQTVMRNLQGEAQIHHLGATGGSFLFNAWWYLHGPLLTGLGALGLLLTAAGAMFMMRAGRAWVLIIPVVLCLGFVICNQNLVWDRWALPLLPLLALSAGCAWDRLCAWGERFFSPGVVWAQGAVLLLLMVPLVLADRDQALGRMNDTRQRASAWASAHIPAGSSVMLEHFAFDLYPRPWHIVFPLAEAGCIDVRTLLLGKVGYNVIDTVRAGRANIDYGTMPRSKDGTCRTDFAILTQYDRYGAEKDIFPQEYGAYQKLVKQGRILASFAPQQGVSSGPIVRIVDFRPITSEVRPDDRK